MGVCRDSGHGEEEGGWLWLCAAVARGECWVARGQLRCEQRGSCHPLIAVLMSLSLQNLSPQPHSTPPGAQAARSGHASLPRGAGRMGVTSK